MRIHQPTVDRHGIRITFGRLLPSVPPLAQWKLSGREARQNSRAFCHSPDARGNGSMVR
jgi:hypothetical protein